MDLNKINLQELDIKEYGVWPKPIRIAIIVCLALFVSYLAHQFFVAPVHANINKARKNKNLLKNEFKKKYNLAVNLDKYKSQMDEVHRMYEAVSSQIPQSEKLPELLDAISAKAKQANLSFDLIKPGEKIEKNKFYLELPIKLRVIGTYHGFGWFCAELTKLQRIVTLHDFEITKVVNSKNYSESTVNSSDGKSQFKLIFELTAKTYWLKGDIPDG